MPLPENPAVISPFSQWDLAQVESPLFITNAINDFAERPLYLTGNWSVKPHLSISCFYDGNIFVRSHDTASDFITRVAPGVTMRLGNTESMFYLEADYTAGFNWYMEHFGQSNVDQNVSASLQWALPKTIIGLHLGFSSDTGTDIEASNLVRQQLYFIGLTTHYTLGDKTSLDLNGDYTRSDFDGFISSSQFDASAFFNYNYSPKTQIGIGGAAGYVIVPGEGDQTYQQLNLRATYRATGKLTFIGEVGGEIREFSLGGSDNITPVFNLSAAWDIRAGTQLNLSFQRQLYVSAFLTDQDYTATSVDISITQRITDYISASLTLSYINTDYTATSNNVYANREDNYMDIRPAVQWSVTSWLSIGVFYEYSQNFSSGLEADSFQRDRGGVDFAFLSSAMNTHFTKTLIWLALFACAPLANANPPQPASALQPAANYRLSPKDTIHIKVFHEDDLEITARVDKDGNIPFPLLGTAKIGGQTVQEATATMERPSARVSRQAAGFPGRGSLFQTALHDAGTGQQAGGFRDTR